MSANVPVLAGFNTLWNCVTFVLKKKLKIFDIMGFENTLKYLEIPFPLLLSPLIEMCSLPSAIRLKSVVSLSALLENCLTDVI